MYHFVAFFAGARIVANVRRTDADHAQSIARTTTVRHLRQNPILPLPAYTCPADTTRFITMTGDDDEHVSSSNVIY